MNPNPRVPKAVLVAVAIVLAALAAALAARPTQEVAAQALNAQWPHTVKSVADLFPAGR
jgi:hypothetical protein